MHDIVALIGALKIFHICNNQTVSLYVFVKINSPWEVRQRGVSRKSAIAGGICEEVLFCNINQITNIFILVSTLLIDSSQVSDERVGSDYLLHREEYFES